MSDFGIKFLFTQSGFWVFSAFIYAINGDDDKWFSRIFIACLRFGMGVIAYEINHLGKK